ncbi:hypothetical protein M231_01114 [Tremella mesenterica]|uniref:Uncharacterized protein n=1 Tax=Tremella mesenterica TaxID=5217 RepID=A0A4Q1BU83_TREME|nr:hypothetical protein M231_01114 [Tremella mesenterica]
MSLPEVDIFLGDPSDVRRARQLISARNKLKSFRASRSSNTHISSSSLNKSSATKRPSSPPTHPQPLALSFGNGGNTPKRTQRPTSDKDLKEGLGDKEKMIGLSVEMNSLTGNEHRRSDSKIRNAHRRQRSSINSNTLSHVRPSVRGVFDHSEDVFSTSTIIEPSSVGTVSGVNLRLDLPLPRPVSPTIAQIGIIPPTPMPEGILPPRDQHSEQDAASRLKSFSFGPKRSTLPRPGNDNQTPPLSALTLDTLEEHSTYFNTFPRSHTPTPPDESHINTPSSRPPSLLLTRPTPMGPVSPNAGLPAARSSLISSLSSPSPPPTPARKRHSHSRSSSISLPNLKLGRPASLGVTSPIFPSSPCSPPGVPDQQRNSAPKLKFEPSGRGAEAEMSKDESRRKALDRLNGRRSSSPEQVNEISLPELDDLDTSPCTPPTSVSPTAFEMSEPPLAALTGSQSAPAALGGSKPWSSPRDSGNPAERYAEGLGFGIDFAMPKRASMTRQLSVLAEVDEVEEEIPSGPPPTLIREAEAETKSKPESVEPSLTPTSIIEEDNHAQSERPSLDGPPSSGLRPLHLISKDSPFRNETPDGLRTFTLPRSSTSSITEVISPTSSKGYGKIGRGRPRPLSGISGLINNSLTSVSTTASTGILGTPRSAERRRPGSKSSRGSSISYKKDESTSSRDWSFASQNSKTYGSPPLQEIGSPPSFASPSWGGFRSNTRPCPRPRSIMGLGFGANRVLSEVREKEEEPFTATTSTANWSDGDHIEQSHDGDDAGEYGHESRGRISSEASEFGWQDGQLELEVELEAVREDLDMWRLRCRKAEDALEAEKKEMGNRLSSISALQPSGRSSPQRDPAIYSKLQDELFHLTSVLEVEKREKAELLIRLQAAESSLASFRSQQVSSGPRETTPWDTQTSRSPMFATRVYPATSDLPTFPTEVDLQSRTVDPEVDLQSPTFPPELDSQFPTFPIKLDLYQSGDSSIPTPIVTPATPLNDIDPNLSRIRTWGFPSSPVSQGMKERSKRESFFGLSNVVRKEDEEEAVMGFNVFPFVLHDERRVVSLPLSRNPHPTSPPVPPAHSHGPLPINNLHNQLESGLKGTQDTHNVQEALSQPKKQGFPEVGSKDVERSTPNRLERTGSATSAALNFLSGYLPIRSPAKKQSLTLFDNSKSQTSPPSESDIRKTSVRTQGRIQGESSRGRKWDEEKRGLRPGLCGLGGMSGGKLNSVDMRNGCRYCVGDVIEI